MLQRVLSCVIGLMLMCSWLRAEELPVRVYTSADGLPHDDVLSIRRDSHGYLWLGTAEGLSIFDGNQFVNFTTADGLPNRAVHDILETRNGEYWLATYRGVCRFDPKPVSRAHCIPYSVGQGVLQNQVNRLIETRDGSIWAGTEGGLWRLTRSGTSLQAEGVPLPSTEQDALSIPELAEDQEGKLWVASGDGLFVIERGKVTHIGLSEGLPGDAILSVIKDSRGRIWATSGASAVCQIAPGPRPGTYTVPRVFHIDQWSSRATKLFQTADGRFWVTGSGLFRFEPDGAPNQPAFRPAVSPSRGDFLPGVIAEDADGNLWLGGSAATKVTLHGFTTFSRADGLRSLFFFELSEDREGHVVAVAGSDRESIIQRFDGTRFTPVPVYLPRGFRFAWGWSQIHFQDHTGNWWVPTLNGVMRFASPKRLSDLAHTPPEHIYTTQDGLPNDIALLLYEDSRADVWIGVYRGLARWQRRTGRIDRFGVADGLPLVTENPPLFGSPVSMAEDALGDVWVGFHPNGLARYHQGKFEYFSEGGGVPKGQINRIFRDHLGRLWIASNEGGAARVDDVTSAKPSFRIYTTAQGLSSNQVISIVEDRAGRIYFGGGKGVDRLDPASGNVRHFTAADGLPPSRAEEAFRDRTGALWFASGLGLSRYVPEPDRVSPPQSPLIRGVRIAGKALPVSELGEPAISGLRLADSQNNLRIEFGSLNFRSGEVLRYQYRMRSADADWSLPAGERTVTYSALPPGSYEFAVRAVNGDGLASPGMASISFVIVPPLWKQSWAIAIEVMLLALGIYAAHWYRLRQLLQVERIRMRLASDLHDDIGSGLAEIALLSEVAATQPRSAGEIATRLGDRARQLREGMSEIVWSVDPRQRSLSDLTGRVRQSVYSMLESNGRRVEFEGPEASLPVAPDRARQVLLICRESITNIARHADASEVSVRMELRLNALVVDVRDNGRGFNPDSCYQGMGLRNLRRRAREAGGELVIDSSPGRGTRIRVRLPLQ